MDTREKTGCASSNDKEDGVKFETKEVIIHGGTFAHAHFGTQEIHQSVYIDQRTLSNHSNEDNLEKLQENYEEFLRRANLQFAKQAAHVVGIQSVPKISRLDMDGSLTKSSTGCHGSEAIFGRDVEELEINELHSAVNRKQIRHVMVLGESGAGKSTLSRMYGHAVHCHNADSLNHVKLVVLVNAFDLFSDSPSKVFDLFFTHQMAVDPATELTQELQEAGLRWINENTDKILVCIDGLDQCNVNIGGKRYPKATSDTAAYADTILANIMSGNIWNKAVILTTSRWSVYWTLMTEQKPDKVVGLRGFDESNLEKAAQNLVPDGCDAMLTYIKGTAPKLLALCQNPMFLSYTSKVFKENINDLPDSISSLMAAVFLDFMHSRHLQDPDFENVARLAFLGMMETRFEFSINFLKKHRIDPESLEGFLAIGALRRPGQREAKRHDKKYTFCHQSMQEFCAVMHVVSLEKAAVADLISTKLNENSMTLMRKLLYGVILNDKITQKLQRYLEDNTCSIEDCREILLKKMLSMLSGGVIYDIRLITLIAECGSSIIEKIKHTIDRVHIGVFDLLKNDQRTLVSFIKQCPSLKKVFIQQLWLDPFLVESVLSCYKNVIEFKGGYEVMDSIDSAHLESVMNIFDNTKVIRVNLRCSDDLKNQFLSKWIERDQITFPYLGLLDVRSPDIISKLYKFLSKFKLKILRLNLNFNPQEAKSIKRIQSKLCAIEEFVLEDKHLTAEKMDVYLDIFKTMMAKSLMLCRCDLTVEELIIITESCIRSGIKLVHLQLIDKVLPTEGYRKLPSILKSTGCQSVAFESSNLGKKDIVCLRQGLQELKFELKKVVIIDRFLEPQEYAELPSVLDDVQCLQFSFVGCELTYDKLSAFGSGCSSNGAQFQIETLYIQDHELAEKGYKELSGVVGKARCRRLVLSECDLNKTKLLKCSEACHKWNVQWLILSDDPMEPGIFLGLAILISKARCPNLVLSQCDINSESLQIFYQECKRMDVTMRNLVFDNEGLVPPDNIIIAICEFIHDIVDNLTLKGWIISEEQNQTISHALNISEKGKVVKTSVSR